MVAPQTEVEKKNPTMASVIAVLICIFISVPTELGNQYRTSNGQVPNTREFHGRYMPVRFAAGISSERGLIAQRIC